MSTGLIMKWYAEFGGGQDNYSEEEHKQLTDAVEELAEDWIDVVFESEGKLTALDSNRGAKSHGHS